MSEINAYVDGGCFGNGKHTNVDSMYGSYRIYEKDTGRMLIEKLRFSLSGTNNITNNCAEWTSLFMLVCELKLSGFLDQPDTTINIFMDSELVVKQYSGVYRIKKPHLKEIFKAVKKLTDAGAATVNLTWISGEDMKKELGH